MHARITRAVETLGLENLTMRRRKDRIVVYQLEGEQLELPTIEESAFEVQGVGV